jgi:hypothetical protein
MRQRFSMPMKFEPCEKPPLGERMRVLCGWRGAESLPSMGMVARSRTEDPTSDDGGYWVVSANGSVFTYGDAPYDGGASGIRLNGPIIAASEW